VRRSCRENGREGIKGMKRQRRGKRERWERKKDKKVSGQVLENFLHFKIKI